MSESADTNPQTKRRARGRVAAFFASLICILAAVAVLFVVTPRSEEAPSGEQAHSAQASSSESPGAAAALSSDGSESDQAIEENEAAGNNPSETIDASQREEPAPSYVIVADEETGAEYVEGSVLLSLADGVSVEQVNDQLAQLDFVATKTISEDDLMFGYAQLELMPGVDTQDALARLEQLDITAAAQPDYVYHLLDEVESPASDQAFASPSPTLVASLGFDGERDTSLQAIELGDMTAQTTAINDTYSKSTAKTSYHWMLDAINAYEAWDCVKSNHAVTVAVLDSGLNINHEDFVDANGTSNIVGAYSVLNGNSNVTDTYGHGTHVAGIISAAANNGKGVAGVSYNANIMPVQVIDSSGDVTTSDACSGVNYILNYASAHPDYNVRVINMSFGSPMSAATSKPDKAFLAALTNAENAGMLITAAAGNNANTTFPSSSDTQAGSDYAYKCFPVDFDSNLVGVINLNKSGSSYVRASGSNFNIRGTTTKDLGAPGTSIYSTVTGGGYGYKSGTSMAAPCVAGVAALLFAAKPGLTATQVKAVLCNSAKDLGTAGFDLETGYGMVDAHAALLYAVPSLKPTLASTATITVDASTTLSISNAPSSVTWTWKSSNTAVATVSSRGKVSGAGVGKATITATSSSGVVLTCAVTVARASIAKARISGITAKTYTGLALTQPLLSVTLGSKKLKSGADYKVTYANNVKVGIATVKVTGVGSYKGSVSTTFKIVAKPTWSGASMLPVGARATYTVTGGGSLKALSGGTGQVALSGKTIIGKKAGTVKLALCNAAGQQYATKTVTVYTLSGPYYVCSAMNSSVRLDINGATKANGGDMIVWQANGGANQKFVFALQSDGYFTIKSVNSGKLVDVSGCSKEAGGNVIQWQANDGANQRWMIAVDASNRLSFKNKNSGLLMDVNGGSATNGTSVIQWYDNGGTNQKWTLASAK